MTEPLPPEKSDFGPVLATEDRLQDLWNLVHSRSRLQKAGYVLWTLGPSDLEKKKRCGRCTKVIRKGHEKQKSRAQSVKLAPTLAQQIAAGAFDGIGEEEGTPNSRQFSHARSVSLHANGANITDLMQDMTLKSGERKNGPPMNCKYHPGSIRQRQWTCCNKNISSPPCAAEQFHTTRIYRNGELETNWQYFTTPHPDAYLADSSLPRPSASTRSDHVAAVVIDCEMGTAQSGESELIRVSAVDFFTRAVLVDSLVWPDVKMAHFNTRYSGVTRQSMEAARRTRRTLQGRAGAREALWRCVGPHTVVIGHSLNSDLTSLRWIHNCIVDTLLLEMRIQPREEKRDERPDSRKTNGSEEGDGCSEGGVKVAPTAEDDGSEPTGVAKTAKEGKPKYPGLSLKALAAERLKREIQIKGQGHDSLEDALATRDLLLWHMINKPEPPVFAFE